MSSTSNNFEEVLTQLIEITGLNKITAENVLRINNNNLEQAINYHLENNHDYSGLNENSDNFSSSSIIYPQQQSEIPSAPASESAITNSNNFASNNGNLNFNKDNKGNSAHNSSSSLAGTAGTSSGTSYSGINYNNEYGNDDNVRPPIPSRREQLLLPEEDNFRFRKRRTPAITICPLRNFAREAEFQEQQLLAVAAASNNDSNFELTDVESMMSLNNYNHLNTNSSNSNNIGISNSRIRFNNISAPTTKRSRLEDLFRPPTDLLFWGTFQTAKDYATSLNRWLIVNLQDNSEFKSQILNRDIWPDPDLKELILKYFILWQISVDNPEGLRFKTFYHVYSMPYVCIIDPRTGENKLECEVVTPQQFFSDLNDFLVQNSFTLETIKPIESASNSSSSRTSAYSSTIISKSSTATSSSTSTSTSTSTSDNKYLKASELSEEDQLELAIKNSLMETHWNDKNNSSGNDYDDDNDATTTTIGYDDSTTTQSENDTAEVINIDLDNSELSSKSTKKLSNSPIKTVGSFNGKIKETKLKNISDNSATKSNVKNEASEISKYEQYLGDKNDPITKIQLKLPDGTRNQLEWPSTTKLRAIYLYVKLKYPEIAKEPFKIILSFPRQNLLDLDDSLTLKCANLHPSATLYLHPDE